MRARVASLAFCALVTFQGCTHLQIDQLAAGLAHSGPEHTLAALEAVSLPDRDRVQYLLDRGLLKIYTGDLVGGREDLEAAKLRMASLRALSAIETAAAITVNETLRKYSGTPSDQVLVHVMLAFAYLFAGDTQGARVEMLQADVTMQQLSDDDSTSGQLASARFLAGVVYELNGERDDAMISYRRAYEIMHDRGEPIPPALQVGLLNLSWTQGLDDEYEHFATIFSRERQTPAHGEGQWILIYHDGVVSSKRESRFTTFAPAINGMVSVVMPEYPPDQYRPRYLSLRSGEQRARTSVVENLEDRAREDLEQENAALLAAAAARAVTKYQVQREVAEYNDFAGFLATVYAVASEQADIRSWNMLPSTIQIARVIAPVHNGAEILEKNVRLRPFRDVTDGGHIVVFATSLNDRIFTFPPSQPIEKTEPATVQVPVEEGEY